MVRSKSPHTRTRLRTARATHIRDTLAHSSDNPCKFWRELNALIKQKASTPNIVLTNENNDPIYPTDIPNYINNYFSTIGPKLAEQFSTPIAPPPSTSPPSFPCPSTYSLPIHHDPHL